MFEPRFVGVKSGRPIFEVVMDPTTGRRRRFVDHPTLIGLTAQGMPVWEIAGGSGGSAKAYTVTTEGEEALGVATVETLVQVRGNASLKSKVTAWGASFDGVSVTGEPGRLRLLRQTTDGTGTGATEALADPGDAAALCTGFHTFTAEPTAGEVLREIQVHPQGGHEEQFPLGREKYLLAATTSRIGIDALFAAAVNASSYCDIEEG
ncbi:MAG: hypothetical protein ACRDH9_03940 [Actinomycetota bacterium]